MSAENDSPLSSAAIVICQGSWCRLATAPGQAQRPRNLAEEEGLLAGPYPIAFRFANCLGLCGKGANAKIEQRIPTKVSPSAPRDTTTDATPPFIEQTVFLKDVHQFTDTEWLKILGALASGEDVQSAVVGRHIVTPAPSSGLPATPPAS